MIKIAHLYYDILNLYGEQGNVKALVDAFKYQNVDVDVSLLSLKDKIDFTLYDMFYIGSGSKEDLLVVLEDIMKYKKDIKNAINKGKYIISTGNSHELFGKFIEINDSKYNTLDLFPYYAKENPTRISGECFMQYKDLSPIVGFQNRACVMHNEDNHLFRMISGHADNFKSSYEGYEFNNFIGTYLIGPLLIRNPHLTDLIVKNVLESKKLVYHENTNTILYKAYKEYLKNFYEE